MMCLTLELAGVGNLFSTKSHLGNYSIIHRAMQKYQLENYPDTDILTFFSFSFFFFLKRFICKAEL